ncbi:MAG TPA: AMP-binding protein [Jatrophihabitantaceae bacterium]
MSEGEVEPGVGVLLTDAARRWPGRRALSVDGRDYRFDELLQRAGRYAAMLTAVGVRADDAVLMQLPNGIELVALTHAAWLLGAVPVPIVSLYRERELASVLADCRPRVIVGTAERGTRRPVAELDAAMAAVDCRPAARWCIGPPPPGWQALDDPAAASPARPAAPAAPPAAAAPALADRCVVVLYTSGTTSEPKGVMHDSRTLLATVETYRRAAALDEQDTVFVPAPMGHVGALVGAAVLPCVLGASVVLLPRWQAAAAAELIAAERVTFAAGASILLAELVEAYEGGAHPEWRVPRFHTGAAAVSPELVERAEAVGITAWRAWGMTEFPSIATGGMHAPRDRRVASDGRIEPGVEVKAVDPAGRPVPEGTEGELFVRGAKLMLGYSRPDRTAESVDADGWFRTGDRGVLDAGWVTVTGRVKDLINRGGEKFAARDIEDAICAHPVLAAAAVLGAPDPRWGEVVVAFVTVRPGADFPGERAMAAYLSGTGLARQKVPVAWRVVDRLPRTATGKVEKRTLLARWLAGD